MDVITTSLSLQPRSPSPFLVILIFLFWIHLEHWTLLEHCYHERQHSASPLFWFMPSLPSFCLMPSRPQRSSIYYAVDLDFPPPRPPSNKSFHCNHSDKLSLLSLSISLIVKININITYYPNLYPMCCNHHHHCHHDHTRYQDYDRHDLYRLVEGLVQIELESVLRVTSAINNDGHLCLLFSSSVLLWFMILLSPARHLLELPIDKVS